MPITKEDNSKQLFVSNYSVQTLYYSNYKVISDTMMQFSDVNKITYNQNNKIIYDAGPKFDNKHPKFKGCSHTKTVLYPLRSTLEGAFNPINVLGGYVRRYEGQLHTPFVPNAFARFGSKSTTFPSYSEVYEGLQNEIDGNMTPDRMFLSTIFEFVSGKGLVKTLTDMFSDARKTIKNPNRTFKEVAKTSVNTDLGYRFGVAPVIGDVKALLGVLSKVQEHVNNLSSRSGKDLVYKHTISKSLSESEDAVTGYVSRVPYTGNIPITATHEFVVKRTMFVRANVKYSVSDSTFAAQILRDLGFMSPLATAWDLLPFSFVFDYFVDFGSKLTELENRISGVLTKPANKVANLTSVWVTDKIEYKTSVNGGIKFHNSAYTKHCQRLNGGVTYRKTVFNRYPLSPEHLANTNSWELNTSLTARQHQTILELLVQRKR